MLDKTKVHIEITDLIVPEVRDDLGTAEKLSASQHGISTSKTVAYTAETKSP